MESPDLKTGTGAGWLVLLLVFIYFWIGISPLANPGSEIQGTLQSNLVNQIVVVCLLLMVIAGVRGSQARSALLGPHIFLLLLLFWFSFVSLSAIHPEIAFRRIAYAVIVCVCANAALLLPRNSQDFARVIAIGVSVALLLSYFTVIALPGIGIHQITDASETQLAGDWRGHFGHKNAAAAAMVYAVLFGLYLRQTYFPKLGTCIIVFAAIFLFYSGGKTSTAMLPVVLMLVWMFERWRWLRFVIVLGVVALLNMVLIGSAIYPPVTHALSSLGLDATFTGRTTIWAFALDAISHRPLTGYGFQSFWNNDELATFASSSWAKIASHSHNSFIETLINAGIPGLFFIVIWLLILPIRDAARAFESENDPVLTRLFLRIWMFSILLSCLENVFFVNTGPLWFSLLISVFGMRLQSRAVLAHQPIASKQQKVVHA